MWALDPANSGELIDELRPHARDPELFSVVWVGEGWRDLVRECHRQLREAFPDYELLNVKQTHGALAYQAFPRRWEKGGPRWSTDELEALDAITDRFGELSETVCEWCGATGRLREWRTWELTLCDTCDARFSDPPYRLHGKRPKRPSSRDDR